MEKFTRVEGIAASIPKPNIDTDVIIAVSYQRTLNADPGKGLFAAWRYDLDGNEIADFILNQEPFRHSKIIVGDANFGCGSSREFAVWALMRFGIRCVIASSFGDIFYENSFKNGLLPIILSETDLLMLRQHLKQTNDPTLTVDLAQCRIELSDGNAIPFKVPAARRNALLEGLDEIGQSLQFGDEIDKFEAEQRKQQPWIYARPSSEEARKKVPYVNSSLASQRS